MVSDVVETAQPGSSTLSYDPATQRYQYVWQTKVAWARTCRTIKLTLTDGTTHKSLFTFR